jgi:hypothetical protein
MAEKEEIRCCLRDCRKYFTPARANAKYCSKQCAKIAAARREKKKCSAAPRSKDGRKLTRWERTYGYEFPWYILAINECPQD